MTWVSPVLANSILPAEETPYALEKVDDQAIDPSEYIGIRHVGDDVSAFPDSDLSSMGGWLVYPAGSNQFSDYGIGMYNRDAEIVVLLEKMVGRSGRSTVWDVMDAILIEEQSEYFLNAGCSREGESWNGQIFAYMRTEPDEEYATDLLRAWQVNFDTETIETIDTTDIICVNPGYGV